MKKRKMSEVGLSGLKDKQDLTTKKILKSSNQVNHASDNMKQGWQIKKLGEVCEISTGKSNTEDAIENGNFAFLIGLKL